jgi:hypothetical protein
VQTAARAIRFDCSAPLAAMFAGLPLYSSDLSERKSVFHHLLLQISGANIENPPPPSSSSSLAARQVPTKMQNG